MRTPRAASPPPASVPPTAAAGTACPNCGAGLLGRYCHACGQKRIEPEERRFAYFVRQWVRGLTMVDGRLIRSLLLLVFRPGTLDRAWLEERRRTYVAPLSLFLLANLVYFFHPPLTDLNLPLADQVGQMHGALARAMIEARLAARGIGFAEYAAVYEAQAHGLAKLMVILHVPALAAILLALHPRRGIFYVDHMAVALHFWAFLLIHAMVTPSVLGFLQATTGLGSRLFFQLAMAAVTIAYLWRQLRVGYDQPGWRVAVKLPPLLVGFALSHLIYRFVQFLVVFAAT